MKKLIVVLILFVAVVAFLLYFILSIGPLVGYRQVSNDIEDAKNNGVFIAMYKMKNNPFIIDGHEIDAKEIWLEYRWSYNENSKPAREGEGYTRYDKNGNLYSPRRQLLITLKKPLKNFNKSWSIGDKNNYRRMFRYCSDYCIMVDFDEGDNIPVNQFVWDIYAGELKLDTIPPIIGQFELTPVR